MSKWTTVLALVACAAFLGFGSAQILSAEGGAGGPGEINQSGTWETTGNTDVKDLFPNGTPGDGDGIVTVTNEGPGDIKVRVQDENGNTIQNNDKEDETTVESGNGPGFTVPAGGTIEVRGGNSTDAEGTWDGTFPT